jgi:hypothetical protein
MYLDLQSLNDGNTTIINEYQNLRIVIASFNQYKNETNDKNHIKFVFENIPVQKMMKDIYTNGGYSNSDLKLYLEGGFLNGLKAALRRDYMYRVKRHILRYEWHWGGEGSSGVYNEVQDAVTSEIFIDTATEVFGTLHACEADLVQTALYAQGGGQIKNYYGEAASWWVAPPVDHNLSYIVVSEAGINDAFDFNNSSGGVVPAFCIY